MNALMRTALINVRAVIQLTLNQTKREGFIMHAPAVGFSQCIKGRASLFEAFAAFGEPSPVLQGVGCDQEGLI